MAEQDHTPHRAAMIEIYEKAWSDPEFRQRFIENPKEVLREAGIPVLEDANYRVVETGGAAHEELVLVLPARPSTELEAEELASVAGGASIAIFQQLPTIGPTGFPLVWG